MLLALVAYLVRDFWSIQLTFFRVCVYAFGVNSLEHKRKPLMKHEKVKFFL